MLLELQALSRALHQVEHLRPAKHELIQLNAIRATAFTCQLPLEEFLAKISKFEAQLGVFNARYNRYKGFGRRLQWRMMYKEDAKQLRSILGSHVATITLLLMTQAVGSITAAEDDRQRLACGLENKILAHRRLLERVNEQVESSIEQQLETKLELRDHSTFLEDLRSKADQTQTQLRGQEARIREVQITLTHTREQNISILSAATDILTLATSGVMNLRLIAGQLRKMLKLCATFTTEMQIAMAKLMQLFFSLHTTLRRIEALLPLKINLPIVQFTDALGDTIALPYQLCQKWATFRQLLGVIFNNKQGKSRVEMDQFLIMNARGGRLLTKASWQHAVKQDDHLSMSIILDNLPAKDGHCPFPSCQAFIAKVEVKNGGRTCPECRRWAVLTSRKQTPSQSLIDVTPFNRSRQPEPETESGEGDSNIDSNSDLEGERLTGAEEEKEDIEVYRQIHVQIMEEKRWIIPISNMDSPLGRNPCPPLHPTEVLYSLQASDGQIIRPEIFARIDKGFFIAENDWTCYRRNYFSVNCSFSFHPAIPNSNIHLFFPLGSSPPVIGFTLSIAAVVDGRGGKSIELIQHTPQRDKGPLVKPARIDVAPRPPPAAGMYGGDTGLGGSRSFYDPRLSKSANAPATEATFERIQFKNATANGGKRRVAKHYYNLLIELFADIGAQHTGERWFKIASRMSVPMVVRGRPPGHYRDERRGSTGSEILPELL